METSQTRPIASQSLKELAQDLEFFFPALFGKGQIQVAQAHFAEPPMDKIHERADALAESLANGRGNAPMPAASSQTGKILKLVAECGQLGTVSSQEKYFKPA